MPEVYIFITALTK